MTPENPDEFGDLTDALVGLRGEVHLERLTREQAISMDRLAITVAIVAAVVGALINGFLILRVWQQADELHALQAEKAVSDCERGNDARAAIVNAFNQYTEALIAAGSPSTDPARQARIDRFRADIRARLVPLAQRDCSAEAVTPATVNG